MTDFQFSALSIAIVCLLAVIVWKIDERRQRKEKKRGNVVEMRPYFSEEEKERWML